VHLAGGGVSPVIMTAGGSGPTKRSPAKRGKKEGGLPVEGMVPRPNPASTTGADAAASEFEYTGLLRPGVQSPRRTVSDDGPLLAHSWLDRSRGTTGMAVHAPPNFPFSSSSSMLTR